MAFEDFHPTLERAEKAIETISHALLQGEPEVLEAASRDLQQTALALASLLAGGRWTAMMDQPMRERLNAVLRAIVMQREATLRRGSVVERSLHSILPASRASTYGGASSPYGSNARQSGAFKLLAA